jgi:hypothetical protein
MPQDSPQNTVKLAVARDAVSNGSRALSGVDGRSAFARRFKAVTHAITEDLGGADHISEGQRQLARQAASLSVAREIMDARLAEGEQIDMEEYTRLGHLLVRTLTALGLKRHAKDVGPRGISQRLREAK